MRSISRAVLLILVLGLTACGMENPFSSDTSSSGSDYYFDGFPDVPIPSSMSIERGETAIATAPGGIKAGVEQASGRVEVASLTSVMSRNMSRNGWTLRSAFRSAKSVMVFEKHDRICTVYIEDGTFTTTMQIFVTMKLAEGDTNFNNFSTPTTGTGGTSQPLNQ